MPRHRHRHPAIRLAALILLAAQAGCHVADEPLRDAWALWIEYEPMCSERIGDPAAGLALPPRWHRALEALAAETLSVMEERLAAASVASIAREFGRAGSRPRATAERLADLVAGSRRLCELTRVGVDPEDGAVPAAVAAAIAATRADVAAVRSRLAIDLRLDPEETLRRSARYSNRLSEAVARALEEPGCGPDLEAGSCTGGQRSAGSSPGRAQREPAAESARRTLPAPVPTEPPVLLPPAAAEPADGDDGDEKIWIEAVSGESWEDLRRRREQEAERRMTRWRPLYRKAIGSLAAARERLAEELGRESLQGLSALCAQLGLEAERLPPEVVELAPEKGLAIALARMTREYKMAGRACSAGRPVVAWGHLEAADGSWTEVSRSLERLGSATPVPRSLLLRSRVTRAR